MKSFNHPLDTPSFRIILYFLWIINLLKFIINMRSSSRTRKFDNTITCFYFNTHTLSNKNDRSLLHVCLSIYVALASWLLLLLPVLLKPPSMLKGLLEAASLPFPFVALTFSIEGGFTNARASDSDRTISTMFGQGSSKKGQH